MPSGTLADPRSPRAPRGAAAWAREESAALVLGTVAVVVRLVTLTLPEFAEVNYEEATVGLMARHILGGEYVVFWWGNPYLGSLYAYPTALLFWLLGPTTVVLRLVPAALSLVAAGCAYGLARDLVGPRWALVALLWWALPPAFLTRMGAIPYNYIGAVTLGTLILWLTHRVGSRARPAPGALLGLGLIWGIALWDHLIALAPIGASVAWLGVRAVRGDGPWPGMRWLGWAAAGFALGSTPLWLWNVTYRFETVTAMVLPAAAPTGAVVSRFRFVGLTLAVELLGRTRAFWGQPLAPPPPLHLLGLAAVYLPAVLLAAVSLGGWLLAAVGNDRLPKAGERAGLALLALALVLAAAQIAATGYNKGFYLMPIYTSLPILLAASVRWLAGHVRWLAALPLATLVGLHLVDHATVLAFNRTLTERRPVDAVIAGLAEAGIGHVYAHYRVAWPLAFESGERFTASDYHGYMTDRFWLKRPSGAYMRPFWRAIAEVDRAPRVALVTHEPLGLPRAVELAESLKLLGGRYRTTAVGPYTIFHDWQPPPGRIRAIESAGFTLSAGGPHADTAALAADANLATAWTSRTPQREGLYLEATLDTPRRLAKLVLDPGLHVLDYPRAFRIEVSADGIAWREAVRVAGHVGGMDWHGGHPKLSLHGHVAIWIDPVETRRLRVTLIGPPAAQRWRVAELLLYEAAPAGPAPAIPDEARRAAVAEIRRAGIRFVYASDEVSLALARELPPAVRTLTLRDRRFAPLDAHERLVRFHRRNAFLLPTRSRAVEDALAGRGVAFERFELGGAVMYVSAPRPGAAPLYWRYERLFEVSRPS